MQAFILSDPLSSSLFDHMDCSLVLLLTVVRALFEEAVGDGGNRCECAGDRDNRGDRWETNASVRRIDEVKVERNANASN